MKHNHLKKWLESGQPYIWLNAGAVSVSIIMVAGLLMLIAVRGLTHFWPAQIVSFDYDYTEKEKIRLIGEIVDQELVTTVPDLMVMDNKPLPERRYLIKTGNRDHYGLDFRWVTEKDMSKHTYPEQIIVVERREWGNFYGYLKAIKTDGKTVSTNNDLWQKFQVKIKSANRIFDEIRHIERDLIGAINYKIEKLRLRQRELEIEGINTLDRLEKINNERADLESEYQSYTKKLEGLYKNLNSSSFIGVLADGKEIEIPFAKVVRAYQPNAMTNSEKIVFYFMKLWEFMSEDPREANTEGGIFPAIFGTVLMVMIMSVIVTPFGVVAAIYLHEYARQGILTRIIRIAVNNLAGVPSVVYGVFGLGFFVYFLGGSIDRIFFPEALPTPTFGTPGLMWASLTLAILTVPVVIVATEEGLSRVPRAIREGSLALGATQAETLWRTVLPMTASAMITGLILAVARAAGEVAPLMLVGVVKLAPSLPLDGNYPFLHLDRKFMHLGFHIYDVGFQSPNVEAARPLVYSTALLLVAIIVILNLTAIRIRNKLRVKYSAAEQH